MTLDDVIAMFESAEAGSLDLDYAFAKAIGEEPLDILDTDFDGQPFSSKTLPHYTTNLQHAVDAVPEGWKIASLSNYGNYASVQMIREEDARRNPCDMTTAEIWRALPRSQGRTPQLALCLAILRCQRERTG